MNYMIVVALVLLLGACENNVERSAHLVPHAANHLENSNEHSPHPVQPWPKIKPGPIVAPVEQEDPTTTPSIDDVVALCLKRRLRYLDKKPSALKEFTIAISEAATACHASQEQLTRYVEKIIERHGDYQGPEG